MRVKEKSFIGCTGNRHAKTRLHNDYIQSRQVFGKTLRRTERSYRKSVAVDIETMSSRNPNDFWEKIRNLGPRRNKNIPFEVIDESGNITRNEQDVLERWRCDFENLYNGVQSDEFDFDHYLQANIHKTLLEQNMEDPLYTTNNSLNAIIITDEIHKIVMQSKLRSSSGFDEIPYDILKFPMVIDTLHQLFQWIFDTSIIPSVWRKAIICPILKYSTTDPRIPMNYRGVSLLSCVSKIYSAFINKRLTTFLENEDILVDEQNGFRKNRSCEDHIFTLNIIVRNNQNVFSAFIDLKKCFDFIDRDMMLYKLLLNNIDGKIYNSVKSIYQHTNSCVRINNKLTNWFDCRTGVKQGDNV